MQAPSAADLLCAWDAGSSASCAQRALILLQTVHPESAEQLAAMPLGWVSAQLLQLRAALLGPIVVFLSNCRQCGTVIESQVGVEQLTALASDTEAARARPEPLRRDDYCIEFRLPNCADLLALQGTTQSAARMLAQSLIERASQQDVPIAPEDLPSHVLLSLECTVLERDPLARIDLGLACPDCGLKWSETLPVIDFVWTEIAAIAERLLIEVARLASAFGWREADILAMSAHRRRRYLELLPT